MGELYQQAILAHNRAPLNRGTLHPATHSATGANPICGDTVTVTLRVVDDAIEAIRFDGEGCAISRASASMMTEAVRGLTGAEIESLYAQLDRLIRAKPVDDVASLGELSVLEGLRAFPTRIRCATLPWKALLAALDNTSDPVTTE